MKCTKMSTLVSITQYTNTRDIKQCIYLYFFVVLKLNCDKLNQKIKTNESQSKNKLSLSSQFLEAKKLAFKTPPPHHEYYCLIHVL